MQTPESVNPISKYRFIPPAKVLKATQKLQQQNTAEVSQNVVTKVQINSASEKKNKINLHTNLSVNTVPTKSTTSLTRQAKLRLTRTSSQQHNQSAQKQTSYHNQSCNLGTTKNFFKNKNCKNRLSSAALKSSSKPKYISTEISDHESQQSHKKILTQQSTGNIAVKYCIKDKNQENYNMSEQRFLIKKLREQISELKQRQIINLDKIKKLNQQNNQIKCQRQQFFQQTAKAQRKQQQNLKKIKLMQRKINQKCQEHELIINSLKKVINSQFIKIEYLQKQHMSDQVQKCNQNNIQDSYQSNSMELGDSFQQERQIYEYDQDQQQQEQIPKTLENRQSQYHYPYQHLNQIQTYKKPSKRNEQTRETRQNGPKIRINSSISLNKGIKITTPAFPPCTPTNTIKQILQEEESEESSYNHFNKYIDIQENVKTLDESSISHSRSHSESQSIDFKEKENILIVDRSNDSAFLSQHRESDNNKNKENVDKGSSFLKKIGKQVKISDSRVDKQNFFDERCGNLKKTKSKVQNVKAQQIQTGKQNKLYVQSGQQLLLQIDRYLNQWKNK